MAERSGGSESTGTVLVAGVANLLIAVAKAFGGIVSGSSAMLSESAHSVADTMNQVFLLTALKRSGKAADVAHPFGYGKERYFWSLLAAVGIFVLGAGFSVRQGVVAILDGEESSAVLISFAVLGVSFLAEGASWLKAVRQVRREAGRAQRGFMEHLRHSPDPTVKTVALEDTAALIGLLLAAAGVGLHAVTGSAVYDGLASIAIGALLVVVAWALGRDNKAMLVGQSVGPDLRDGIREVLVDFEGVVDVIELLTMRLGPQDVLVAARIDLADRTSGADVERLGEEAERRLRERFPEVRHVFLDPTVPDEARSTLH